MQRLTQENWLDVALGDRGADPVCDLGRDLGHAVVVARVDLDLLEDLLVRPGLEDVRAPRDQLATDELLHGGSPFVRGA